MKKCTFLMMVVLGFCSVSLCADTPALRTAVTYKAFSNAFDITFTFDKPYTCGQYANGDWFVVTDPATKTVVIKQITPECANGRSRFPELNGKHIDAADTVAPRRSAFGDEMWKAYRKERNHAQ
jgi:hypothetical protein